MITNKESQISFRIASKTIHCNEISKILNWQASEQFEKGEQIGRNPKNIRDKSIWIYNLDLNKNINFEQHIETLLNMIYKKKDRLKKIPSECELDLFCGYATQNGQGGFMISSEVMRELGSLKIDLIFDLYVTD